MLYGVQTVVQMNIKTKYSYPNIKEMIYTTYNCYDYLRAIHK